MSHINVHVCNSGPVNSGLYHQAVVSTFETVVVLTEQWHVSPVILTFCMSTMFTQLNAANRLRLLIKNKHHSGIMTVVCSYQNAHRTITVHLSTTVKH